MAHPTLNALTCIISEQCVPTPLPLDTSPEVDCCILGHVMCAPALGQEAKKKKKGKQTCVRVRELAHNNVCDISLRYYSADTQSRSATFKH